MLSTQRKIRVMVVDDSAVIRAFLTKGLAAYPFIDVVGYAINAMDAKNKIPRLNPDVMTLDVEMPGMSGIDFLSQLLPEHPLPVILVSSLNLRVFDALAAGAVDFVRQPADNAVSPGKIPGQSRSPRGILRQNPSPCLQFFIQPPVARGIADVHAASQHGEGASSRFQRSLLCDSVHASGHTADYLEAVSSK